MTSDDDQRFVRVEANALAWIDNMHNWGLWEYELRGVSVKAHVKTWFSNVVIFFKCRFIG